MRNEGHERDTNAGVCAALQERLKRASLLGTNSVNGLMTEDSGARGERSKG